MRPRGRPGSRGAGHQSAGGAVGATRGNRLGAETPLPQRGWREGGEGARASKTPAAGPGASRPPLPQPSRENRLRGPTSCPSCAFLTRIRPQTAGPSQLPGAGAPRGAPRARCWRRTVNSKTEPQSRTPLGGHTPGRARAQNGSLGRAFREALGSSWPPGG